MTDIFGGFIVFLVDPQTIVVVVVVVFFKFKILN
jgi:hypothetical protein